MVNKKRKRKRKTRLHCENISWHLNKLQNHLLEFQFFFIIFFYERKNQITLDTNEFVSLFNGQTIIKLTTVLTKNKETNYNWELRLYEYIYTNSSQSLYSFPARSLLLFCSSRVSHVFRWPPSCFSLTRQSCPPSPTKARAINFSS